MAAIVSLLMVLMLSLIATRIATVALTLTGLSQESARFQARSALTGCGFTTAETEQVMEHPVRRRIIMLLMLLGNAGIVTAVSSLILAFVRADQASALWLRLGLLLAGVVVVWAVASSAWIARRMERVIRWALGRWTTVEVRDYASLLRLSNDFAVSEISVDAEDWVVGRTLAELDLHAEGITVLGIQRGGGTYIGVPTGQSVVLAGDLLLAYGRTQVIEALDERHKGTAGDRSHQEAVRWEAMRLARQKAEEMRRLAAEGAAGEAPPGEP